VGISLRYRVVFLKGAKMFIPKNSRYVAIGLLMIALSLSQALIAAETARTTGGATAAISRPAIATAKETAFSTVEDGGTGPFKAIQVGDSSLETHTIFRPKDMNAFGDNNKLPIISWGNGACANSPSGHLNYLSEIASHGFLVIAIGPYQPAALRGRGANQMGGRGGGMMGGMGGGTKSSQLLDAIDWAIAQNSDKASIYYDKIDISKIGVAGHSCGGLQAIEVSADPRITATIAVDSGILNTGGTSGRGASGTPDRGGNVQQVPGAMMQAPGGTGMTGRGGGMIAGTRGGSGGGMMMPALTKDYLAKLHVPILYLLGGESDMAYVNGMDDFKRIEKIPVFVASQDVGHGGTFGQPHGGDWAMVSTAWFKWQLKGDAEAGKLFTGEPCELAKNEKWTVEKKNIP
jgi:hypothetical protein